MSLLAKQQEALLQTLFAWPPSDVALHGLVRPHWERGLQVYRANGHGLAMRALGAVYPVLAQLLGAESFSALARAFWHAQPPRRGDVTCWGEGVDAFLRGSDQVAQEPYLGDVAAVEWALHQCARAADRDPDPRSFALLIECQPEALALELAPGWSLVRSPWPVVAIVLAHLDGAPGFEELGRMLHAGVCQDAVVWRDGLRPSVRQALPGEAALLGALGAGASLAAALDAAPDLQLQAWLTLAAQGRFLLGARRISPDGPVP